MYVNVNECGWAKMTHIMGKNDTYPAAAALQAALADHEVLGRARSCARDGDEAIRWPQQCGKTASANLGI